MRCVLALSLGTSTLGAVAARGQIIPGDAAEIRTTDLIRLAESFADAVGELKIATLRLETLTTLRQSIAVSGLEIEVAKVNLQTAERKVSILRAIAEKELAAAQTRLEILKRLEEAAQKRRPDAAAGQTRSQITQAEAIVKVLQMILDIK